MKVEIKKITPAKAREWLALNTGNRTIRKTVVSRYAADMASGNWQLNGQPIVLNGDKLMDGQHRLLACVDAGIAFDSAVVTDAPEGVMDTIDQGVGRSLGDVLNLRGFPNAGGLASAVIQGWKWENGKLLGSGGGQRPSIAQSLAWLAANPEIASSATFVKRLATSPLKLRASIGAPIHMLGARHDHDAATEFFDRLLDGEHLAAGDAVYALRRLLIRSASNTHHKMPSTSMAAYTVKSWNFWIMGDRVENLRWGRGGTGFEPFPVMIGADGEPLPSQGRAEGADG